MNKPAPPRLIVLVSTVALAGFLSWAITPRESTSATTPVAPGWTQADVPAAILGEAPPPDGTDVHYFEADPATTGYLAVPEGEGPFPAVILIHEWNGLVDRVRQMADALAEQGYVALAADLYSGRTGSSRDENMALVRSVRDDMASALANLDAAASFLRTRDDVTGKVGTVGWCFGGGMALSYALGGENHDATAIFYGSLVTDPEELRTINHEIYGTFAAQDRGIPPEQVHAFADALQSIGIGNDIHIYDDVDHGFWLRVDEDLDTRLSPAADAWARLKRYFNRALSE